MRDALRVFRQAVRDRYDGLFLLVWPNLLTMLLAVPVATGVPALAWLHPEVLRALAATTTPPRRQKGGREHGERAKDE